MTNPTGQITWRRDDTGTPTPMWRAEHGLPWLRCDRHPSYRRTEYEITAGMTVWVQLKKQGYSVLESELR